MSTGVVFDIKRIVRRCDHSSQTFVLLKGCLLRCLWCCYPESLRWDSG
jgi:pyruvate formate lyase activating enzyme